MTNKLDIFSIKDMEENDPESSHLLIRANLKFAFNKGDLRVSFLLPIFMLFSYVTITLIFKNNASAIEIVKIVNQAGSLCAQISAGFAGVIITAYAISITVIDEETSASMILTRQADTNISKFSYVFGTAYVQLLTVLSSCAVSLLLYIVSNDFSPILWLQANVEVRWLEGLDYIFWALLLAIQASTLILTLLVTKSFFYNTIIIYKAMSIRRAVKITSSRVHEKEFEDGQPITPK